MNDDISLIVYGFDCRKELLIPKKTLMIFRYDHYEHFGSGLSD